MWTSLLLKQSSSSSSTNNSVFDSALLTRTAKDDKVLCSSLVLDLSLYLLNTRSFDKVLWIRPAALKTQPAPSFIAASDVMEYDDQAREVAQDEPMNDVASSHSEKIEDVYIKYVSNYEELKLILVHYHLISSLYKSQAIFIEDLDQIVPDPLQAVEIIAIATELLQSLPPPSVTFLGAFVTLTSRTASTSKLSRFFNTRIDLCEHPTHVVCVLKSTDRHSGKENHSEAASMGIFIKGIDNPISKRRFDVKLPTLFWTCDVI